MTPLELKSCPFCGMHPPEDLSDTLYPTGIVWKDLDDGFRSYDHYSKMPDGTRCYAMHCSTHMGGCGAEMHGDTKEETIAAWNRRPAGA